MEQSLNKIIIKDSNLIDSIDNFSPSLRYNNSSYEGESTNLERFETLFTNFMANLKRVKHNSFNKKTIECLYPSRQVQRYLNIHNNFRHEYITLFTNPMIILMENILNGTSRLESSVDGTLSEIKEFFIKKIQSYFQNESINSEIPICEIERHISDQFESFLGNTEFIENSTSQSFVEISTFIGTLIMTMSPEDLEYFFQNITNPKSINDSVYHFHLLFSTWSQNVIPYETFKNLFIESANGYKNIHQSIFSENFLTRVQLNLLEKNFLNNDAGLDITNKVIHDHAYNATIVIREISISQQETINLLVEKNSFFSMTRRILENINWIIENRISVGIGSLVLLGGLSLVSKYLSTSLININLSSDLQDRRALLLEPTEIPEYIYTDIGNSTIIESDPFLIITGITLSMLYILLLRKSSYLQNLSFFIKKL